MAYSADTFVADEQPTTAKWNKLWSNDASFNDGTGIGDNAIINRHVTEGSISLKKTDADIAFQAYLSSAQNSVNGNVKINLATELFDESSNFDSATNYRFTAPVAGIYNFHGAVRMANAAGARCIALLYKNGTEFIDGVSQGADTFTSSNVSATIKLAASDYIELWLTSNGVTALTTGITPLCTYLSGHLVGE